METVVPIASQPRRRSQERNPGDECEIIIFPGVRREHHDLDLGARLRNSLAESDPVHWEFGSPAG